ncbi:putative actin monomer binding protein [Neofusicoccum parvum UCRNP2]|uniref:Twinfilin n=2 Tax=Neofusicoccum parvum TaxID=310453 RepID=R1EVF0_BOTPV|nr:putative actin monomer binding protein [Neofusicoccum parvum UCRNP2]GME40886.1 Actin monomer binding protein [Neofusicoccum parvum]
MQSGITASEELHAAFNTLISDPESRFLTASVTGETLVPRSVIAAGSSDFLADLSLLAPHLAANEALYILIRQAPGRFVAVTYVPDAAPVRQKTLTASTRLALVRELGSEKFAETFFATTAEELSADGWRRHEAHVAGAVPLTEEEQNLVDIKEAEARESGGTGARRVHTSGHLSMEVQEGVVEALKSLGDGSGEGNLVQLNIDVPKETFRLVSSTTASAADLAGAIAADEPRYSFYRHAAPDGSQPILFIYTCPPTSKVKERMVYAASRGFAVLLAEKEAGIPIAKRLEFSSPEDITADTIDEEFAPKEEKKTTFAKPKRPGKR